MSGYDQGQTTNRRTVLKDIEKQIGKKPKQYKVLPLPDSCCELWFIYTSLSPSFSLQELKAYCDLTGYELSPDQVDILCNIHKASYGY